MSFLVCTGRLAAGSGLQQLLEVVFAQNSVTHMLTGKAIARAVRGHFLADAVLNAELYGARVATKCKTCSKLSNEVLHDHLWNTLAKTKQPGNLITL